VRLATKCNRVIVDTFSHNSRCPCGAACIFQRLAGTLPFSREIFGIRAPLVSTRGNFYSRRGRGGEGGRRGETSARKSRARVHACVAFIRLSGSGHNISKTISQWRRAARRPCIISHSAKMRDGRMPHVARHDGNSRLTRGVNGFFSCAAHAFRTCARGVIPYRQSYREY